MSPPPCNFITGQQLQALYYHRKSVDYFSQHHRPRSKLTDLFKMIKMNTTQLFIEQLLSGFLSLLGLVFLTFSIYGFDPIFFSSLIEKESLVVFCLFSFSYPLGIFSDNLADALLKGWEKRIKSKSHGEVDSETGTQVNFDNDQEITAEEILRSADSDWLTYYFTYSRKRIRISRSSAFGLTILTFGGIGFLLTCGTQIGIQEPWKVAVGVGIAGLVLVCLAIWNWWSFTTEFHNKSKRTWEYIKSA